MFARIAVALAAALIIISGAIGIVISQDGTSTGAEVRIAARQLEDGRVEFALQQMVDGEWGARVLPDSRYFPADPQVGRWLNSAPVALERESSGPIVRDHDGFTSYQDDRISTFIGRRQDDSGARWLESGIYVRANTYLGTSPDEAVWLVVTCRAGVRLASIQGVRLEPARDGAEYFYNTRYDVRPVPSHRFWGWGLAGESELRWGVYERRNASTWSVDVRMDTQFYLNIREADSLQLTLVGNGRSETFWFWLADGFWETPVQPNIDGCGNYY